MREWYHPLSWGWMLPILAIAWSWSACVVSPALAGDRDVIRLYVATDGNDAWSGLLETPVADGSDGPLATLEGARDRIRLRRKGIGSEKAFTVSVRGGTYRLERPLTLSGQDGGTEEFPVRYESYPNERPVLLGGREITGFQVHKGRILKADLSAAGLEGADFQQLFFGGERQRLARLPNFIPDDPFAGGWLFVDPARSKGDRSSLTAKPGDIPPWLRSGAGEVVIFPRFGYWNDIVEIGSVDRSARTVSLEKKASFGIDGNNRYFFQNLPEALDAPGEWYLDREENTLYFWPPSDVHTSPVHVPTLDALIVISGTQNLVLEGFTMAVARGAAIEMRDCRGCRVVRCVIRGTGGRIAVAREWRKKWVKKAAIDVKGGWNVGIVGNDISDVGHHAISLSGGERKQLRPGGHFADNNYIHHPGAVLKEGAAIILLGVGNRASRNLIHDVPRTGIKHAGNDHVIELNHIRHVALETSDTGAIHGGNPRWISRGTVIRHNFVHDVFGLAYRKAAGRLVTPVMSWAIYLDMGSAGIHVQGNVAARALSGLLMLNNARDNLIENNIFVDGMTRQIEMNGDLRPLGEKAERGAGPAYEAHVDLPAWRKYTGLREGGHPKHAVPMAGNRVLRNIFYYRNPRAALFLSRNLRAAHFQSDRNLIYHFGLPVLIEQRGTVTSKEPPGGRARGHLPVTDEWSAWQGLGFDHSSLRADVLFADADNDDFRLKEGSPAFELGFEQIPFDDIGPYPSKERASWPIIEAEGARENGYRRSTLDLRLPGRR